ncbi:MAG: ubiquinol-cytochrome c reductase iron-sulfur subunit [Anaerolineales bacterium]
MASPTVAKAKTASQPDETAAPSAPAVQVAGVSRREFLYYAWGASLALFLAQSGGMILWFSLPRFREGEFGGIIAVDPSEIPEAGAPPMDRPDGKFWVSYTEDGGVLALYKVCTHLGCLYAWVDANNRFECPCHGSKFAQNGDYIEGPAPRGLDRFALTVVTSSGEQLVTDVTGNPVFVDKTQVAEVLVDTGNRIQL